MHVELYDEIFLDDYTITFAGEGDCRDEPHGEEDSAAILGKAIGGGCSALSYGDGAGEGTDADGRPCGGHHGDCLFTRVNLDRRL